MSDLIQVNESVLNELEQVRDENERLKTALRELEKLARETSSLLTGMKHGFDSDEEWIDAYARQRGLRHELMRGANQARKVLGELE